MFIYLCLRGWDVCTNASLTVVNIHFASFKKKLLFSLYSLRLSSMFILVRKASFFLCAITSLYVLYASFLRTNFYNIRVPVLGASSFFLLTPREADVHLVPVQLARRRLVSYGSSTWSEGGQGPTPPGILRWADPTSQPFPITQKVIYITGQYNI